MSASCTRVLCPALLVVLIALARAGASYATAECEPEAPATDFEALGREIVELVRAEFFDPEKAAEWAAAQAGYSAGVADGEAFARLTREAIAELEASHTEYYTPEDVGYYGLLAIFEAFLELPPHFESAGLAARRLADGWYVERVFSGTPAAQAGVLRGDRLLTVDGEPFHPVRSWRGKDGRETSLEIERRPGERLALRITPRRVHPKEEWLAAQRAATRVVEHAGKRIAVAALWSCAGTEHLEALEEAVVGELAGAAALVIDLRGGWGGCSASFLDLFNPYTPVMESIAPDGERSTWSPAWRKPLVVLVDSGSRSGKEMVSRAIQRHGVGTLVGQRTAGRPAPHRQSVRALGRLALLPRGPRREGRR